MAKIEETVPVKFKWLSSGVDPIQFKPFGNQFTPQEVYIQIDLPIKYVLSKEGEELIISPEGMAWACHAMAKAVSKSYSE